MAKINDFKSKKNQSSGGYDRLFVLPDTGKHYQKVHSTVIRNGCELSELIIKNYKGELPYFKGKDCNTFKKVLSLIKKFPYGIILKEAKFEFNGKKISLDYLIIHQVNGFVYVIEIKDGNNLDTKKTKSEIDSLESVEKLLHELGYCVKKVLVAFNCGNSKHNFKDKRVDEIFMNGIEFCKKFNVSFEGIIYDRKSDRLQNELYHYDFIMKEFERLNVYGSKDKYEASLLENF